MTILQLERMMMTVQISAIIGNEFEVKGVKNESAIGRHLGADVADLQVIPVRPNDRKSFIHEFLNLFLIFSFPLGTDIRLDLEVAALEGVVLVRPVVQFTEQEEP